MKYLNLADTEISDAGLINLGKMAGLESLDLTSTKISDDGLAHLYGLKNLKTLTVRQTEVTAAGADKLQKALPQCNVEQE